ncbi:MAG: hypothetical protein AAFO91_05290, partial [Bacteroidota bacterium]
AGSGRFPPLGRGRSGANLGHSANVCFGQEGAYCQSDSLNYRPDLSSLQQGNSANYVSHSKKKA